MEKAKKVINFTLRIISLFVFVFVLWAAMDYSFYCYASIRIIVFSLLGVLIWLISYKLLGFFSNCKNFYMIESLFSVAFFFLTFALHITCRNDTYSIVDYGFVLDAAEEYVEIGKNFDSSYFANFTVNAFLMLTLSAIIGVCRFLHLQDYYIVFCLIASFIETIAMISCAYLVYKERGKNQDSALTMLLFSTFFPMYALMPFLYNDMLSFCNIVVTLAIIRLAYSIERKWFSNLLCVVAGMVLGFGILIKFTITIQVIALGMILIVNNRRYKKLGVLVAMISTCFVLLVGNTFVKSQEFVQKHKETENPVSSWIATGMSEDGSFRAAYGEFIKEMYAECDTKEEKDAYCREYIKKNYKRLFDASHLIKKTKRAYGLSSFGAAGEYSITPEVGYENNLVYKCFDMYGKHYAKVLDVITAHFGSILMIYVMGICYGIYTKYKKRQGALLAEVSEIAFVGYFFYLMISETSHHQIFNLMPLVFVGAAIHISTICSPKTH